MATYTVTTNDAQEEILARAANVGGPTVTKQAVLNDLVSKGIDVLSISQTGDIRREIETSLSQLPQSTLMEIRRIVKGVRP